ncbi:hypothetical protein [Streptosporangium roseum]|uniref:hypothetical protein n=1 Tax=Streptosporangium roseum TaxID=2001 RepID=UPI0033273BD7
MRKPVHRPISLVLEDLALHQAGIVTRRQALGRGLSRDTVSGHLNGGRWQAVHPRRGVYATFTGPLNRAAQLWAAVLACGTSAMLSHYTAAELWGFAGRRSDLIHVTMPHCHSIEALKGVRIHYSSKTDRIRHPAVSPPRTRLEETVIALTQVARDLDEATAWISQACGSRLTTSTRLTTAFAGHSRLRWRAELTAIVTDVAEGAHSLLETRYFRKVERAHALPRGRRQLRRTEDGTSRYDDVTYERHRTIVHLDGRTGHIHQDVFRDMRRDNAAAAKDNVSLRYGYVDVTHRPCAVAAQISRILITRGWKGCPVACCPACPVLDLLG